MRFIAEYTGDSPRVSTGPGMRIIWQEGPLSAGVNGAMPDLVISALLHRITDLDAKMPCEQNREIIGHLNAILGCLDARTRDRFQREVMGTAAV